jgi:hypothetical protein
MHHIPQGNMLYEVSRLNGGLCHTNVNLKFAYRIGGYTAFGVDALWNRRSHLLPGDDVYTWV